MLRSARALAGYDVRAADGEVGRLEEIYFDDELWTVRYLVVRTGSLLFGRRILVSPEAVVAIDDHEDMVRLRLSRAQIAASPDIDLDLPVSRQAEAIYRRYHGWPAYWTEPSVPGVHVPARPAINPSGAPPAEELGDPHLLSSTEVTGYRVFGADAPIGRLEDVLFDDSDWRLRSLVVDTGTYWPAERVLIAPDSITRVSTRDSTIRVSLVRSELETRAGR